MTERIRHFALWTLSATLLVSALRNWFVTVRDLRRFYANVPIWDAFEWLSHYSRYRSFDLSVFWIQHNEHREIGTELLFALDMLLFHGRQILPTVAGVAAYVGILLLFVACAFIGCADKWSITCAALMMATFAGYKMCVVSLATPFLTSWPQWEFFGVAALAAAVLHSRRSGKLMLILSILCAVLATYSMSNGMLVWPLLVTAALILRVDRKQVLAIAITGAIAIGAYFIHYRNLHSLALGTALSHPIYLAGFLGSFLGMPFSAVDGFTHPWRANTYGLVALAIAIADLVWIIRKSLFSAPAVIVIGGYCLLAVASASLTAAGRIDINDPFFQAARAGRYITEPILFWCALVMLTAWLLRRTWNGFAPLVFVLALAILSAVKLPRTVGYYNWWSDYFRHSEWAAIAVGNGVVDDAVSDVLFPSRQFVAQFEPVLAANHLAVFADAEPGWIGRQASQLFRRGEDTWLHGAVTTVKKRGSNYEVQGWVDNAAKVIFVDDAGRILGFGQRPNGGIAELYSDDLPASMAYTGFIRGDFGAQQFWVFAVDRQGRRMWRVGHVPHELPR